VIGTVETAGSEKKTAFSNVEELWEILRHRKRKGKKENMTWWGQKEHSAM